MDKFGGNVPLTAGEKRARQRDFLHDGRLEMVVNLLTSVPQVEFFVKTRESNYVAVSPGLQLRLGCLNSADVFGKNDYDFVLPSVADEYLKDDQRVVRENMVMKDQFELFSPLASSARLVQTTKFPVADRQGDVIGLVGVIRQFQGSETSLPMKFRGTLDSLSFQIVAIVQENLSKRLTVRDLSKRIGVSEGKITKVVNSLFEMSVAKFVERVRFQSIARELLLSNDQIGNIAERFGFQSASAFCVRFGKATGVTPMELRKNWEERRHQVAGVQN